MPAPTLRGASLGIKTAAPGLQSETASAAVWPAPRCPGITYYWE
ncbi:hypothetical protein GJA_1465 [Janthinobacterium agaricidamnosum NBRC 102515 = DSM 9628]|uniref:Uncharacterized protein n=1 Tax=Janthinobacterium agaricidamnosum NBRC 102515 = DSM 9628 TaxID=1349767 RepID=W0V2K9_9BURK|nr:hypothetical protein GJA_1465 [Janthinobacterium agaricidamnosum NBRC 102515 = DSM 9628]